MTIPFLKSRQLHHLLVPVFFVLDHFNSIVVPANIHASIGEWLLRFVFALAIWAVPMKITYLLFRLRLDTDKSALLASVIFIPILFFRNWSLFIEELTGGAARIRWVFLAVAAMTTVGVSFIILTKKRLWVLNQFFTAVFSALCVYIIIVLVTAFKIPDRLDFTRETKAIKCTECPDVYFFLLDAYTSNKSLRDFYGFNNSDFVNALGAMGFQTLDQSSSQYGETEYSIASTLNFGKLSNLEKVQKTDVRAAINNSSVVHSFAESNYEIHNYSFFKLFDRKGFYRFAPISGTFESTVINGLYSNSIFDVIESFKDFSTRYDLHQRLLSAVYSHSKVQTKPSFYYIHLLAPHPPFVIGEHGEKLPYHSEVKNIKANYVAQVKGVNTLILPVIERIRENNPNAVILIQGDHGSRLVEGPHGKNESLTVFQSCYFPGGKIKPGSKSNLIFNTVADYLNQ